MRLVLIFLLRPKISFEFSPFICYFTHCEICGSFISEFSWFIKFTSCKPCTEVPRFFPFLTIWKGHTALKSHITNQITSPILYSIVEQIASGNFITKKCCDFPSGASILGQTNSLFNFVFFTNLLGDFSMLK